MCEQVLSDRTGHGIRTNCIITAGGRSDSARSIAVAASVITRVDVANNSTCQVGSFIIIIIYFGARVDSLTITIRCARYDPGMLVGGIALYCGGNRF